MVVLGLLAVSRRTGVRFAQDPVRVTLRVCRCQPFNQKSCLDEGDGAGSEDKKTPRPKTVPVPKITLLSPNNSMTVTVLAEAERLAKRRNLTLIKVEDLDSKTERPVYKLVSSSALIEETAGREAAEAENIEDKSQKSKGKKFKDTKILHISANIAEHDARVKAKNVLKLLSKRHQVKVIINLNDAAENKAQNIIEEMVSDKGKVQQMPAKKNFVQLLISPLSDKSEDSSACNKDKIDASSM